MNRRRNLLVAVPLTLALCPLPYPTGIAQSVFRASVETILVTVTVTDSNGRYTEVVHGAADLGPATERIATTSRGVIAFDLALFDSVDELLWNGPTPAFAPLAARIEPVPAVPK